MRFFRKRQFLAAVLLLALLCSCGRNTDGPDTDPAQKDTQAGTDSASAEDTVPPKAEGVVFPLSELNIVPYAVRAGKKGTVKPELQGEDLVLFPLAPGTDTVTVYNSFSEQATVDVTVAEDLTVRWQFRALQPPPASRTVQAQSGNITAEVQAAVDALSKAGGGTVYVPAGSYSLGTVSLKDGVAVRFEGFVPDVSCGYTDGVKELSEGGRMARIVTSGNSRSNFFFVNVDLPQSYCTAGHDRIAVYGGCFDCQAKMKFIGMSCADGAVFENILIKDIPNNHAFQIEGCTDVLLRNLMFAGYNYPAENPVLTRETIQIEPTTPGAIGSDYATNVIQCDAGDYHHNYGVTVTGCYFGKSDKYGPQLVALGHHSATGGLACDGLEFSDNTVDNPLYCGLHLLDTVNVRIVGNTFRSDRAATASMLGTDSALISIYGMDKKQTYTDPSGKTVTYCEAFELPGVREVEIRGNEFEIGGGTHLKAFYVCGTENAVSAKYTVSNDLRTDSYGGTARKTDGYLLVTNLAYGVTLRDNLFRIPSAPSYNSYFIHLKKVNGLAFDENRFEIADGVTFRYADGGTVGVMREAVLGEDRRLQRTVSMSPTAAKSLTVDAGGQKIAVPNPTKAVTVTFRSDGNGDVRLETDADGNLTVRFSPAPGYAFSGFTDGNGNPAVPDRSLSAAQTYVCTFVKQ